MSHSIIICLVIWSETPHLPSSFSSVSYVTLSSFCRHSAFHTHVISPPLWLTSCQARVLRAFISQSITSFSILREGCVELCRVLIYLSFVYLRSSPIESTYTPYLPPILAYPFPSLHPFLSFFFFSSCNSIRLSKQEEPPSQRSRPLFLNTTPRFWFTVSLIKQKLDNLRCCFFCFFSFLGGFEELGRRGRGGGFSISAKLCLHFLARIYLFT